MKKKISEANEPNATVVSNQWLDLENIATVEVTSENPSFPVEGVFGPHDGPGWRASQEGEQQIRIVFDKPQSVHRVYLRFRENEIERTQEFTLKWASAEGEPTREIVRQQWNFSPYGSTSESEDYVLNLPEAAVLELTIRPHIGRPEGIATLESWRVG